MRVPLFVANWKMHKTLHEAVAFAREFGALIKDLDDVELVVAPPFTALDAVAAVARNTALGVAAQNLHFEPDGAFTGEISAALVKDAGADYAIVGHSERRRLFGETDACVQRKVRAALDHQLTPIICIGETLEERERGGTLAVLDRQVTVGLESVTAEEAAAVAIAYEPVWAIGTGRNATPAEAAEAHNHIRRWLHDRFGADTAGRTRILYGGSVKPENIAALVTLDDVDGALVGGASLDVRTFFDIVTRSLEAVRRRPR